LVVQLRPAREDDESEVNKGEGVKFVSLMDMKVTVREGDIAKSEGFVEQVYCEG